MTGVQTCALPIYLAGADPNVEHGVSRVLNPRPATMTGRAPFPQGAGFIRFHFAAIVAVICPPDAFVVSGVLDPIVGVTRASI